MLLGDLTPGDRQKIMTVCTVDVHARDVVANLITQKVTLKKDINMLNEASYKQGDFPVCFMCLLGDNRPGLCMAVPVTPSLG